MEINVISDKLISYLRNELDNPNIGYSSALLQLQGGYETSTYRFMLKGAGGELSKFLVLRLYPILYGSQNAVWESTVQNVLAGEGFPVAKAYFVCTDMSILGGAFFIMEYIPGQPLIYASLKAVPEMLGKTHAELHKIDPKPLMKSLKDIGVSEYRYSLDSRFDWLKNRADNIPWVKECVNWLMENRPTEPGQLAVCHGDFHALNILVQDGEVTGVLDWPGFAITDPVYDVANAIVLTTIPAKYLTATMEGFSSVDWDLVAESYLAAYRKQKNLDSTNISYYRVNRCVMALIQGFEGQKIWQHPMIVGDLVGYIRKITDVVINVPV